MRAWAPTLLLTWSGRTRARGAAARTLKCFCWAQEERWELIAVRASERGQQRAAWTLFWSVPVLTGGSGEEHSIQDCSGRGRWGGGRTGSWSHWGAFLSPAGLISNMHPLCKCVRASAQCSLYVCRRILIPPREVVRSCDQHYSQSEPAADLHKASCRVKSSFIFIMLFKVFFTSVCFRILWKVYQPKFKNQMFFFSCVSCNCEDSFLDTSTSESVTNLFFLWIMFILIL